MKFDISARELEDTEVGGFDDYDGELLPTPGWYVLDIDWVKVDESSAGNDMLVIHMTFNNPDDDPELADYVGCPVWDRITILPSTLFRLKPFLDAIGADYNDFVSGGCVVNDEEPPVITKIGSLKMNGLQVRSRLKLEVDKGGEYDDKLRPTRYAPVDEETAKPARKKATGRKAAKPSVADVEDEDEEDEPPRRPAKKAGKKAAPAKKARRRAEPEPDEDEDEDDDEAPF
jgi:hypothetical protein